MRAWPRVCARAINSSSVFPCFSAREESERCAPPISLSLSLSISRSLSLPVSAYFAYSACLGSAIWENATEGIVVGGGKKRTGRDTRAERREFETITNPEKSSHRRGRGAKVPKERGLRAARRLTNQKQREKRGEIEFYLLLLAEERNDVLRVHHPGNDGQFADVLLQRQSGKTHSEFSSSSSSFRRGWESGRERGVLE